MKRLIIHLKRVDKVKTPFYNKKKKMMDVKMKIFNTLNLPFSSEKEKQHHLSMHDGNIKSYRVGYYK